MLCRQGYKCKTNEGPNRDHHTARNPTEMSQVCRSFPTNRASSLKGQTRAASSAPSQQLLQLSHNTSLHIATAAKAALGRACAALRFHSSRVASQRASPERCTRRLFFCFRLAQWQSSPLHVEAFEAQLHGIRHCFAVSLHAANESSLQSGCRTCSRACFFACF